MLFQCVLIDEKFKRLTATRVFLAPKHFKKSHCLGDIPDKIQLGYLRCKEVTYTRVD